MTEQEPVTGPALGYLKAARERDPWKYDPEKSGFMSRTFEVDGQLAVQQREKFYREQAGWKSQSSKH